MKLQAGTFLKSIDASNELIFANTTIFLTEYNQNGAVGFIINRASNRSLNQLEEFKDCRSFPLHFGGPVDTEHLFFLHRKPDLIKESTLIAKDVYFGGNFNDAVDLTNTGELTSTDIKIFIGYCGWDAGELESEIEEGSWQILDAANEEVFT